MEDRHAQMIGRFLSPLSCLTRGVIDALYFLRRDGAFVFTEGYCHPAGGLMGKVMLYPDPSGDTDIFGRRFRSSYKRVVGGKLELIPHQEQLELQFSLTPGLSRTAPRPAFEKFHVEFPLKEFAGVFEHRHSLQTARAIYPSMDRALRSLSDEFSIPGSRLGCTGSTCYGKYEEPGDDIDLVFYGTIAENRQVLAKVKELTRNPENRVFEFGRLWPIRFYWNQIMICSFFNYLRDDEVPLRRCRMKVLEEKVPARGVIGDDTHTIYMPSIVTLTRLVLNGKTHPDLDLIIYDGSLRGEYFEGDELELQAARVLVSTEERQYEALLLTIRDEVIRCTRKT